MIVSEYESEKLAIIIALSLSSCWQCDISLKKQRSRSLSKKYAGTKQTGLFGRSVPISDYNSKQSGPDKTFKDDFGENIEPGWKISRLTAGVYVVSPAFSISLLYVPVRCWNQRKSRFDIIIIPPNDQICSSQYFDPLVGFMLS